MPTLGRCTRSIVKENSCLGEPQMSQHTASIEWTRAINASDRKTYSRNHIATLAGRQQLNVSASVEYKGDPQCADPEQMVVSALASCHMLFFLAIADLKGFP